MFCEAFPDLKLFLFTGNIPQILYYSHFLSIITALFFGFFVFIKNRKDISSKFLFLITLIFSIWSFLDIITWVNADSRVVMFSWMMMNVLEPLLFASVFYFSVIFIKKEDISFILKTVMFFLIVPVFFLASSEINLSGFDISNCEAKQSFLIKYIYFVDVIFSILTATILLVGFLRAKGDYKKQIGFFSFGIISFLIIFSLPNIFGNFTQNWELTQYGLFGMPVFLGVLAYLIVKHQIFGIKLIAAQALIISLVILVGAQFIFIRTPINRWLNGGAFILIIGLGGFLIKSVKREIKTREEIELVSDKLAVAYSKLKKLDNAKTEFLSIASHQLRTPLTSIKGYMSMIMGGDFGKVPKEFTSPMEKIYISNERLIKLVEDLLNISRIETGRLVFAFNQNEVGKMAQEVFDTMSIVAKNKGLKLEYFPPEKTIAPFMFDSIKIREVFSNLVDNSLKYTKQGWVKILLTETEEKVTFCVSDSGMGIAEDELQYIFEKFQRGQEAGVQSEGTGLGLYVCQKIIQAHHGKIWVESKGLGQGSQFYVELDKHFVPVGKE